jgi:chromosome segregation ATPase
MTKMILGVFAIVLLSQPVFAAEKYSKKKLNALRERSVSSLEDDLKTLEEQNKAGNEELAQYKKDIEDRMQDKLALQEKIDKATVERNRLDERVAFQKKQYQIADNEMNSLQKTNDKLQADIKQLEGSLDSQDDIVKDAQNKLDLARGLNKETKSKREKLVQSLTETINERKSLIRDSDSNMKEVARLKKEMIRLQSRLEAANKQTKAAQANFNVTSKVLATEKARNQALAAKVQAKEDNINDLNGMIRAGKEEVERARREQQELIRRSQKADAEKPSLQMQVADLKEQYKAISQQTLALQKGR